MAAAGELITGVDFVAVPTNDLDAAVEFYGTTLGLTRSVYMPERNFAEFETGTVTLSVIVSEKFGLGYHPKHRVPAARTLVLLVIQAKGRPEGRPNAKQPAERLLTARAPPSTCWTCQGPPRTACSGRTATPSA